MIESSNLFFVKLLITLYSHNFLVINDKLNESIKSFVNSSFNNDGTYNEQREYPAIAGKGKKNCKYCEFANNEDLCPIAKRICV